MWSGWATALLVMIGVAAISASTNMAAAIAAKTLHSVTFISHI
ncbi:MAG: hypothetical protein WBQ25_04755 [Nitrososphaeraceae archaeon]